MSGREKKAVSSGCNCKDDLHTWYLPPRYILLALFSNLVGDETQKATATTVFKFPKTDFRIGKPELPKVYQNCLRQRFVCSESWLFFDQPIIIEIEPTFLRLNSVVCWKEDSSFQHINQFVSGLEVIHNAAEHSV